MKFTRSWLEEYIDISVSTDDLCHQLTMAGLEVDEIIKIDNDFLIDVDLTPNRSDCLSVYGIARELNSINNNFKLKSNKNIKVIPSCQSHQLKINIEEKNVCPIFSYMSLENLNSSFEAPSYITNRLNQIGIKLVHPIVDILNYIMIDIGQPMHAYDADMINGSISLGFAKKNKSFKALDGNEYQLTSKNFIISDSDNVLSLAGIIGSEHSAVSKKTKNIIIESAFFNPDFISNKARDLKLHTESSHRFERGVDFELSTKALSKFSEIIGSNKACNFSEIISVNNSDYLPKKNKVQIDFKKINEVIGISLKNNDVINILKSIGCVFNKKDNTVINPSYRFDLNIHSDYIEEVARLYGYDNIPSNPENINISLSSKYLPRNVINHIKNFLYNSGFSECINYSFVGDNEFENMNWKNENFNNHYKISNYMSLDQSKLRSNLTGSLIKNIEYNSNVNSENSYRFFEVSNVYGANIEQILTCLVSGERHDESWAIKSPKFDKYDMNSIAEDIASMFAIEKHKLNYSIKGHTFNKKKYISLSLSITDLINFLDSNKNEEKFENYSKLPNIRRDLSFLIDSNISYDSLIKKIKEINVHSLKKILLFDLYVGKNIPEDKKSLGMGFIFQEKNKTLTHDEVDVFMNSIIDKLQKKFNIQLRK